MKPLFMLITLFSFCLSTPSVLAKETAFNDVHFHLSDYVQQGMSLKQVIPLMDKLNVNKIAVFGIPLQQSWNMRVDDAATKPDYYLETDSPLYYYSAVDASIAREFLSLSPTQQQRFYPMITGFNPADGHAVDHIKKMLQLYPGVFSGIGEFSIHKEIVSGKVAGTHATLSNPALTRLLHFAHHVGLLVILHTDIDSIDPGNIADHVPRYYDDIKALLTKNYHTTIIWAHTGLGRFIEPSIKHTEYLARLLKDYPNLYLDISWSETVKYIVKSKASIKAWSRLIKQFPTRFLFGSDVVVPTFKSYQHTIKAYDKLWLALPDDVAQQVKKDNFNRLFSIANKRVRNWERHHVKTLVPTLNWPFAKWIKS